jgi:hypothetical protein
VDRQVNVQRTSSQTSAFTSVADLVVANSKLEVGYDDDRLMVVLQYLAPRDVASFVQRKGRGGRQVGTRPIMATVLSPYRPADVFYFRNPHLLADPTFRRLPLNPGNALARQIHGLFAFLDWVANRAEADVAMQNLTPVAWNEVKRQSSGSEALGEYRQYLAGVLGQQPDSDSVMSTLLDHERGLYQTLLPELDRAVANPPPPSTRGVQGNRMQLSRLLPRRVPPTLFDDIHLPLVCVRTLSGSVSGGPNTETLPIEQSLSELVPGRVSYRFGRYAWVPIVEPEAAGNGIPARINVEAFNPPELRWDQAFESNWNEVPARVRRRLGALEPRHHNRPAPTRRTRRASLSSSERKPALRRRASGALDGAPRRRWSGAGR